MPLKKKASPVPCCAAAREAADQVAAILAKEQRVPEMPASPLTNPEPALVNALLPYAERLDQSPEPNVELPYALYDAQKEMITSLVQGAASVANATAQMAVLGGIQIQTPPGVTDYFIPLSFEMYNSKGEKTEDLTL